MDIVMSFRSLHHARAAKEIAAQTSVLGLAKLEAEELAGGEHRPSLVDEFRTRAKALVGELTEDEQLEVLEVLDGTSGSVILAAIEGDSPSDDDTGPEETREGCESPSEAASQPPTPAVDSPKRVPAKSDGSRKVAGRLVRSRRPDGTTFVSGLCRHRGRG